MALRDWFRRDGGNVVEEAATAQPGPALVRRSGFEFGIPPTGLDEYNGAIGAATQTDRRTEGIQLYESYLACPWAWASVQAIAKTITGGPLVFDWDQDDGEGDQEEPDKPAEVLACERLFKYCNPREDIRQLMRGIIADLLVFGDAFIEVIWVAGIPVALYSLDSPSMFPVADPHGEITKYVQVTEYQQRAEFEPDEVIHISLDSPRSGVFGVSPTSAAMLPITTWLFAAACLKEIVRKGVPATIHVDMPQGMSEPDQRTWKSQYSTRNLGARNIGNPIVTRGGAVVNELAQRRLEELLHILDQKRDEIVSTYGVSPAEAGIIESGNIGGGTGESQRRTFLVNTCQPLAALVLEKFDYHLAQRGFGISGWHLKFEDVDMRDSLTVEQIRDMRLRNGAYVLNKYRAEIGEPPVDGGDTPIIIDRTALLRWRDIDAMSMATVAGTAGSGDLEVDTPGDEDNPITLKKAEKPDPPVLAPGAVPGAPVPGKPAPGKPVPAPGARPARPTREDWREAYQRRLLEALEEMPRAS